MTFMNTIRRSLLLATILTTICTALFTTTAVRVVNASQDGLDTARQLYASAAFDEALAALSKLTGDRDLTREQGRQVDEYRLFSLYALNRVVDADAAAEALIRHDPFARLTSEDASPRIHTLYDGVRARVLPQLIRERYRAGRTAIEKKDFAGADQEFAATERLIDEAENARVADIGLADMRELVAGFRMLSKAQPVDRAPATTKPGADAAAAAAARSAEKSTYRIDDEDVVPPAPLYQVVPFAPPSVRARMSGIKRPLLLNLTIDASGKVRKAEVIAPLNSVYDRMVVGAAAGWRYKPATKRGVPVAYVKALAVTIQ
jgi:hypothetical protein